MKSVGGRCPCGVILPFSATDSEFGTRHPGRSGLGDPEEECSFAVTTIGDRWGRRTRRIPGAPAWAGSSAKKHDGTLYPKIGDDDHARRPDTEVISIRSDALTRTLFDTIADVRGDFQYLRWRTHRFARPLSQGHDEWCQPGGLLRIG